MYRVMSALANALALLGGIVLSLLILLTCVSILGREIGSALNGAFAQGIAPGLSDWLLDLGLGPITGDFEIIEAGVAFAIFCFIPLCQLKSGHATVDVFTNTLSTRTNRALRMIGEVLFAAVLILIAVQLYDGLTSKFRSGETTFSLEFPVWWGYALSLIGAVAGAIVGTYVAIVRIQECATGQSILATGPEQGH